MQKRAKPALNTLGQTIGSGQEGCDVMAKFAPDVQVPTAPFGRRRHPHVPGSDEVTQRLLHGLPDNNDRRVEWREDGKTGRTIGFANALLTRAGRCQITADQGKLLPFPVDLYGKQNDSPFGLLTTLK